MKIDGNKTYLTMLGAIAYSILSVFYGDMDPNTAVEFIIVALGAGGFRSAMKKNGGTWTGLHIKGDEE